MTAYGDRHAEMYDLFYEEKDYAREARFVHECLERFSETPCARIVDLACGTGRHALALEKLGHDVVGVDLSEGMIRVARGNAAAAGARAEFRCGDLRALAVQGAPFDAATCLFDSIGYVQTNDALEQAFRGAARTVRRGGLFVFEFWHAAAMLRAHEAVRVRRWATGSGDVLRLSETQLDVERQLATVTYTVYQHRSDGTFTSFSEAHVNRYFLVQEMVHWLTGTGFEPVRFFDGFSDTGKISPETWHVVAVARNTGGGA